MSAAKKLPFSFNGFVVPVFTPFREAVGNSISSLNLEVIPAYASYLAQKGIKGILVNGTTGEGPSLSPIERKLLVEAWGNAVKSTGQHLMVQIGGASLPDVLDLAKHAETVVAADSLLCLPDLYFKPSNSQQLIQYLQTVGKAAPNTPLLYYHIPGLTDVNVNMTDFLNTINSGPASVNVPTFSGIKFTSTNLEDASGALRAQNRRYSVFLGSDRLMLAGCSVGIDGFIATSTNIFPELNLAIVAAWKRGNTALAKESQEKLSLCVSAIMKYGDRSSAFMAFRSWVEMMKTAMNLLTPVKVGPVRNPLMTPSADVAASMCKEILHLQQE